MRRHRGTLAAAAVVAALAAVGGVYVLMQRLAQPTVPPSTGNSIKDLQTQLTTSGNAERPAISPDGKFVAYIQRDGNDTSLWIRQTATNSNVEIVPARTGINLLGATVTPDSNFVDFVSGPGTGRGTLWRVPFLGGMPKRVADNVWSPIGWSPDGRQFAFVRRDLNSNPGIATLVVANADGSHERVLARRESPSWFLSFNNGQANRPAWSPDGTVIALTAFADGIAAAFVRVADGSEQFVNLRASRIQALAWLDESSLVVNQGVESGGPRQLWLLSYPAGQVSRLTNDLTDYQGVSLTADRSDLVTARSEVRARIWLMDGAAQSSPEMLAQAVSINGGLAWAGDNLYVSPVDSGTFSVVRVPSRGGPTTEIVPRGTQPAPTSSGSTIVFRSTEGDNRAGISRARGERTVLRPTDPNVLFGGAKADGSNHFVGVELLTAGLPTWLGRSNPGCIGAQVPPGVRRLHDLDKSGSLLLLFLPLYNIYLAWILLFSKGTSGSNSYGPDPLGLIL